MAPADQPIAMIGEESAADAFLVGFMREALLRLGWRLVESPEGAKAAIVALGRETCEERVSKLLDAWPSSRGPLLLLAAPEALEQSVSRLAATGALALCRGGLGGVAFVFADAALPLLPVDIRERLGGPDLVLDEAATLDTVIGALLIGTA